ncbi:hypothetical protein RYZ26_19645 [Terasakiella sp. A23]|uniref:hypothetical protein n=1 Tax=Terasakiella sp. FCG-A23 TaxID=3080561 RepID=UPI002954A28D|nr:hypothetical protein [Terasakiella sp. A23]MDV7341819.1 hypothetical protein [Terasakiella sp. A23]
MGFGIRELAKEFIRLSDKADIEEYAWQAAEAQIQLGLIRAHKQSLWASAPLRKEIESRGRFYGKEHLVHQYFNRIWRCNPDIVLPPFKNDNEKKIRIGFLVASDLKRLMRYEKSAVNRRDKALKKL